MTDAISDPILLPAELPHAIEVRDAQTALDASDTIGRTSPAVRDSTADRELVRTLVTAYGADGVRGMIDSLD